MPKVGTRVVDRAGASAVRAWIAALGPSAAAPGTPGLGPGTPGDPTPSAAR
jgi:hypothetical protein